MYTALQTVKKHLDLRIIIHTFFQLENKNTSL